jgi:hypothetical protein
LSPIHLLLFNVVNASLTADRIRAHIEQVTLWTAVGCAFGRDANTGVITWSARRTTLPPDNTMLLRERLLVA